MKAMPPRLARLCALLGGLLLAALALPAGAAGCERALGRLEGGWHEYRQDEFVLHYALAGEHALRFPAATRNAGVPDVVVDAALQLVAMREMLTSLAFRLPLDSPRYQSQQASRIVVRFQNLRGMNGRAFDEVRRLPSGECALVLHVGSHYRSGNLTPAHELFHLVQYGYTMFKRPWLLEGTARWAETLLGARPPAAQPVPDDASDLRAFWARSYRAVSVWYGLIERCDRASARVAVPDAVLALRYRSGQPVLRDDQVPGHAFIRHALEAAGALDERVAAREGLAAHRWPEKVQRDARHDAELWDAVLAACGQAPSASPVR